MVRLTTKAQIATLTHPEIDMFLSYVNAKLALLVQVSQTRPGATAVLGAGLFQILRDSGVFSTDPDIGLGTSLVPIIKAFILTYLDIADVDAIKKHYGLLLALMRVINCCVVSRGPQNEQTLAQAKKFVSENRLWMLSVFKRSARIGAAVDNGLDEVVDELSDAYMLLISMSGFLDVSAPVPADIYEDSTSAPSFSALLTAEKGQDQMKPLHESFKSFT